MPTTSKPNVVEQVDAARGRIESLVADLTSPKPAMRMNAREALVAMGKPVVPSLIRLLSHPKPHARWEAAKTLCGIAEPIAACALIRALDDRDGDVRWLAAEGLAALGQDGLQPLLAALIGQTEPCCIYEGAQHICHTLVARKKLGSILRPLLTALKRPEPEVAVPSAAYTALSKLRELS
jgi:hypothetical protein